MKTTYIRYALRHFLRNGHRTILGLFCIAAGVATIVALRSLGLMIDDALTTNITVANHGDIALLTTKQRQITLGDGRTAFSQQDVEAIQNWAAQRQIKTTSIISNLNMLIIPLNADNTPGHPQIISSRLIDPSIYPFYGPVRTVDPPNALLSDVLSSGQNDIVISSNLAQSAHLKIGDQVHLSRTESFFTVRGIVATAAESNLLDSSNGLFSALLGFAYINHSQRALFKTDDLPDQIFMLLPANANVDQVAAAFAADFPNLKIATTTHLSQQTKVLSDSINHWIMLMGFAALLMGGAGITHTMLVSVGRRTVEIAVLKTLGAKSYQIMALFMVEAAILGVVGSLIGVILGIGFSVGVQSFTQSIWPQTLVWRVYPDAVWLGILLGTLLSVVFCFLPIQAATAVRPVIVLRPGEAQLPRTSVLLSILVLLITTLIVGLIVSGIVGDIFTGMAITVALMILLLILIVILRVLVNILIRVPTFGIVDLRLALSGIRAYPTRTITTLIMLIISIFSLSLITLMTSSLPSFFNQEIESGVGGNLLVFSPLPQLQQASITAQIQGKPGTGYYKQLGIFNENLDTVNGISNYLPDPSHLKAAQAALGSIVTLDVAAPGIIPPSVVEGRPFRASDAGKLYAVLNLNDQYSIDANIHPGDRVTFSVNGQPMTFEVIGVRDSQNFDATWDIVSGFADFTVPVDSLPTTLKPTYTLTIAQIDDAHLNQTMTTLSLLPGVVAVDVGLAQPLFQHFISTFTTIPTVVAILSLFVGGIVMTNTIALTTLERRRQLGVMKAIGLKGYRAFFQVILENGLISLLGGFIGLALGGVAIFGLFGAAVYIASFSWLTVLLLLGLALFVALLATTLGAWWVIFREKPINVLRYE